MKRFAFYAKTTSDVEATGRAADGILDSGQEVLGNLMAQNETLRTSQSRLGQLGVALGLSQRTMRRIQRHLWWDRRLVVVAVILILALLGLLAPIRCWAWQNC